MANKWTIKALELEEIFSKFHCVPCIMFWDTKQGKYDYRKHGDSSLYIWYLSFVISIFGVLLVTATLIWRLNAYESGKFPLITCGSWFLAILLGCLNIGMSRVLIYYSHEFVLCINLLLDYGNEMEAQEKQNSKKSIKVYKHDFVGCFNISSVCFLHAVPFVLVPAVLVLNPELDPSHWLLQQILGEIYVQNMSSYFWIPITLFRMIAGIFIASDMLRTVSLMCNIMLLEAPIFYECLNQYKKSPLNYSVLSEYDKLFRIRQTNVNACGQMTSTAMGVCFLMMTFSNAFCLYGYEMMSPFVFGAVLGAVVIQNAVTHTILPLVTKMFDLSSGIIDSWKIQVDLLGIVRMRRHIRKILRHTRPISFACGNVGKLRKETKRNYFAALLDGFINVTMTFKQID